MQSWMGIIQTLKDTKRQSLRHSMLFELETSPIGSPEKPEFPVSSIGKNRSLSIASHSQNSLTLPVLERQHKTVRESGVRNRMFTDTGQRRTDIPLTMDTSDEEGRQGEREERGGRDTGGRERNGGMRGGREIGVGREMEGWGKEKYGEEREGGGYGGRTGSLMCNVIYIDYSFDELLHILSSMFAQCFFQH